MCFFAPTVLKGQQIAISRIDQMPNKPSTYNMLDWKKLAKDYDNFVFDTNKTGKYLPLTFISQSDGINYSQVKNIKMYSYVGQTSSDPGEAINIIPALVGASLVGIDKTNQNGINWVTKVKDFFNKKNGQNVYLNNYSAATGGDWWYELMPNIYFYQLYNLYPNADPDFAQQFTTIADRQLNVLFKLGGNLYPWIAPNMNYRAFNLITGQPNSDGTPQPEAAGSIAWLLYQAYLEKSDERYKEGAELALSFLQSLTSNPSYELQLPYGILTAVRMNAEMGTNYDVDKFLNWTFSGGQGTLRGWGTIVGKWNGYDMSGLIGEAKDIGDDYAFVMNGFQHAAALAPVAKYDKRYARAIGKWILNLASASRYFYPGQMPAVNQETKSLQWATQNDPASCIPFEAIKQVWKGRSPMAMGDALRNGWSATDLSLYSGSSVGYLASLITTTNVDGILQIDLNKTDFRGANTYPTYLYYNPNTTQQAVTLNLPSGKYDIYDAISETVLKSNASSSATLSISADGVLLVVLYPNGSTFEKTGNLLKVKGGGVIDFHAGYNYNTSFRIKSFSATKQQVEENDSVTFNCLTEYPTGKVSYKWYINDTIVPGANTASYTRVPTKGGIYNVKAIATDNKSEVTTQNLQLTVLGGDYVIPVIDKIEFDKKPPFNLGSIVKVTATTNAPKATLNWESDGGTLRKVDDLSTEWMLPAQAGLYTIKLTLKNELGETSLEKVVQVKNTGAEEDYQPIIYYSFNGNTKNKAQNAFDAIAVGSVLTNDANGLANSAYTIDGSSQYIYTANAPELNFRDQMTLSFWMKPTNLGTEQYVISHGSWNDRYKISLTPEKKLVVTLNTTGGIIDLADETPLTNGTFYHYVIVYDGSTLYLYRDGVVVNSRAHSGKIGATSKDLSIGRMFTTEPNYSYTGVIDEFRLYDLAVNADYAAKLHTIWDIADESDVSIKKLTVNGEEWNIKDIYTLSCGNTTQNVTVKIEPVTGAKLDIDTITSVAIGRKPGLYNLTFTITSSDGSTSQKYNLVIEKYFDFYELVTQKWNNTFIVNNNPQTNGGYSFVSYKWFKGKEEIGHMQYYSAGKNATDLLDPKGEYRVEVTTNKGEVLHTCSVTPILKNLPALDIYPNPAKVGQLISVDTGIEKPSNGKLYVYSLLGRLVYQQDINDSLTTFILYKSGTYIIKVNINGHQYRGLTLIVND